MCRAPFLASALAALTALLPGGNAFAADWFEKNFYLQGPHYEGVLPPCDYQGVLGQITTHFSDKESTFWNSVLTITGFEHLREVAFRPWAASAIPRRFCQADVIISDGAKRPVYYSIVEDGGFISASFGVEWCVVGLDRNWAYNPQCMMARP